MTSQPELQNKITGIIGRKGTGKSTKLEELLAGRDRILVIDPQAEHNWTPNEISSLEGLNEFFRWNRKKQEWAASFVPGESIEEDVEDACRIAYKAGDHALAIDEISLFTTAGHMPRALGRTIRTGRHRKMDIYWTGLRANEVPRTLTALTDEFILFSQTEPLDLDAIAKRCGVDVADRVGALKLHEYLIWDVWNGLSFESHASPQPASEPEAVS
ncbi:MAG TPA: hypothetical protein VN785_12315 [Candidatus Angelobacter sp.]|nr:hypothetical protein [Candidatus Angelobacter sp.]